MHSIRPAKGKVLAKKTEAEAQTNSGFFLSDNESYQPDMAIVVTSSSDQYKVGETIIYKTYAVQDIKLNGEDHFIVSDDDVLGVLYENNL